MRLRIHGMFLSLFFALALCFSFSIEVCAHDYERSDGKYTYTHSNDIDVSAEDVEMAAAADKEEMTKKFLLHAVKHITLILDDPAFGDTTDPDRLKEIVIFAKAARDPGVFNHGDTYIIGITERGAVTNHSRYPQTLGNRYNLQTEPLNALVGAGNISPDPVCTSYSYDGRERVACAIKSVTHQGVATNIAGFHHAESDLMAPDCSALKLRVTAEQVENETDLDKKRELLKGYVKSIIEVYRGLTLSLASGLIKEGVDPQSREFLLELSTRGAEKVGCFRTPDFFHESIYTFVMLANEEGTVVVNGLDFNLNGLSASLTDPDPIRCDGANIVTAFLNALTDGSGNLKDGNSAFVQYHWDNPVKKGDEVPDFLERGVVPGTSVKESYLEVENAVEGLAPYPLYYIFGSGVYLDEAEKETCESADDDDGCSIAAVGGTHRSALLNLFVTASVLFSVVFLRKRV